MLLPSDTEVLPTLYALLLSAMVACIATTLNYFFLCGVVTSLASRIVGSTQGTAGHRRRHRPSFFGHSTYRRGLPRRRGTDAPHRPWIGVLRGMEVSGSTRTRGAGTAVTAGEVPQLKVASGRHSDTRKRPVRSGCSVANPKALQYCPGHGPGPPVRDERSSTRQFQRLTTYRHRSYSIMCVLAAESNIRNVK